MRLHVAWPEGWTHERAYAAEVVLREWLGLDVVASTHAAPEVRISAPGDEGRGITMPDVFFRTPPEAWGEPASVPALPLPVWRDPPCASVLVEPELPVIFGAPDAGGRWLVDEDGQLRLGLDVLGTAFFMLSRYEETCLDDRDAHGRFPAAAALAHRAGFLERPIVDEYVAVLGWCLRRVWPALALPARAPRVLLSHDVDWPRATLGLGAVPVARSVIGDVFVRRDAALALRRGHAFVGGRLGRPPEPDPYDTFPEIMDLAEHHGLASAFYFIAGHTAGKIDGVYDLDMPWIRDLLRQVHARGHEIGLHPSYDTLGRPDLLAGEFGALRRACRALGIDQDAWGGRQHYLRWRAPGTWRDWNACGLSYDSTLGYAEAVGFRAGTSRAFPAYDLAGRRTLHLRERPLVVMEMTMFTHMGLAPDACLATCVRLAARCKRYGGDFTLLWHNSSLAAAGQKRLYRAILEAVA